MRGRVINALRALSPAQYVHERYGLRGGRKALYRVAGQKAQWRVLRLTERNAFAFIDYLLQFNVVLLNHFAPKRSLLNHPLL